MAWFRVDDGFHKSRKLKKIPRRIRLECAGLWITAGTWSADEELDGHVPLYMVDEFGGTQEHIDALVDSGLWGLVDDGIQYANWTEYQPTRAELESSRERERDRKAAWRAAKAEKAEGARPSHPRPTHVTDVSQRDSRGTDAHVPSYPTRPDPTRLSTHQISQVTSEPETRTQPGTGLARQPRRQLGDAQKATMRIINGWEQTFPNRPPQKHIDDVTEQIQKLVNEGIPPDQIAVGLQAWSDGDSYSAKNIPTHVAKAGRPTKQATGTTRAMQTLDLVKQLEQEENGEPF